MYVDLPQAVQAAQAPDYDTEFAHARALATAGQYDAAITVYTGMLARSQRNADVLLGRGLAYARLQRWAEAERDLQAATEAAPAYADVWSSLGDVYRWSARPALAVEAYDRLVALRPNDAQAYEQRARANADNGLPGRARADYERALALGGDRARIEAAIAGLTPAATPAPAPVPVSAAAPAPAATPPAGAEALGANGYRWAASIGSSVTKEERFDERWNDQSFSIRGYGDLGSLAFEALRSHRFGRADEAWALDAYTRLWSSAYANIRYQHAPSPDLYPSDAGRIEVWQGVGSGWEVSASEDRLNFASSHVRIHGVSAAKYIGNYYVLLRRTRFLTSSSSGGGWRLLGRYYYRGDADNYIELAANSGSSDDALSLVGGRTHSGGASAAWAWYPARDWGIKAGLSTSRATDSGSERSLSLSLSRRW
ncbi:MAG: YaiO family outer membrane beta-barrel protein [Telluria sp.]